MSHTLPTFLHLTAVVFTLSSIHAQETNAFKPKQSRQPLPKTSDADPASKFELNNKSAFLLASDLRSPFWPIGWVKPAGTGPVTDIPKLTLDEHAFNVTSILVGEPSLAVVNGRAYSEGELVRLPKGSAPVRVRVQRISDGSVTLQAQEQMLVVALRRPELSEKKAEAELLNDEK